MNEAKVVIYSSGPVCCSVCAPSDMPPSEVEQQVNELIPTGIDSPWRVSEDTAFASGHAHPCPCPDDPSRTHYLMNC